MKRVLVVEDDQSLIDLYIRLLLSAGYSVRYAQDGMQAANIFAREEIDLVLLDINIPRISGVRVFQIIQEHKPGIKVIVNSVYPVAEQMEILPDAHDYYDKSDGLLDLLAKIKTTLN